MVIWGVFREDSRLSWEGLFTALMAGAVNDLVVSFFICAPVVVAMTLLPSRWITRRRGGLVLGTITFLGVALFLFVAIAEVLFWEEFESRFNLIAVDYLIYPTEVLGNIRESYPVAPILGGLSVVALIMWTFLWRRGRIALMRLWQTESSWRAKFQPSGAYACSILPFVLLFSADSLSFSNNRAINELASNGVATFFRAARTEEIDYHQFYKTLPGDEAFAILRRYYESMGEVYPSAERKSLVRSQLGTQTGLGKLNVIVLAQESLGAQFVGAYGDTRGLTPNVDALAKESLMFKNAFATGTRTVRGLEAMVASFPPIPSESIVKRAGSDNIANWGAIMRANGYRSSFLYGGFGAFDHMNAFFRGNGFDIGDRLNISNPRFTNIWGVSDEDLFHYAVEYFDNLTATSSAPFFSLVLSTSNHKPFTFRPGVPGVPTSGGGREAGVRYADFAIGEFIKEAKTRPWFDNTVIIVIADHDSRVYGRAYVPVEHYRIPVLVYSPAHIAPQINEKVFSSLDLAPTILGLLGINYSAPFYGVDVLKDSIPASRPVMFSHNHNIAWYEKEKLTVLGLQKEVRTFNYRQGKTTDAPTDEEAGKLLAAHLQTAYELFKSRQY